MNMIEWLRHWLQDDNTKIMYFLSLILIANLFDFTIGFINAKFNKEVPFSSSKAIYGIVRKMLIFMVIAFFIPVAILILPNNVGLTAVYTFMTGYLLSEINSILSHFKLAEDDKSMSTFSDLVKKIFSNGGLK